MGNIIKLQLNGQTYILEFNRRAILKMEEDGLIGTKGEQLQKEHPLEFAYNFIRYAFYKNHRDLSDKEIDEIVDNIDNLAEFIKALTEILQNSISVIQGKAEGKNAKWERA